MNIGYNCSQYTKTQLQADNSQEESEFQSPVITVNKLKDDLSKVILEYCDSSIFPMYEDTSRDFWLLERVKKFRIRYFEEI